MMNSDDVLIFSEQDILPTEVPVQIGNEQFKLVQPMQDKINHFNNWVLRVADSKGQGALGPADAEVYFLSLCLYNTEGKGIPFDRIKAWPTQVIGKLYRKARAISKLDEDATIEQLKERIASLQKVLKDLEDAKGKADPTLPVPSGTTSG